MASLHEILTPTVEVPIGEQTLTVRGINLFDIGEIFREHAAELENLYQDHIVAGDELPPTQQLAQVLLKSAPEVVAKLIARACDAPTEVEKARTLPAMAQVQVLIAIAELTFHSEEEVKKTVETLVTGTTLLSELLKVTSPENPPTLNQSPNGSGGSVGM